MECCGCKHMKGFEDSRGEWIDFCANADSGAYLEQVGICGNCELEDEESEDDEGYGMLQMY